MHIIHLKSIPGQMESGGRKGWGHSTWKDAVMLCSEANIDQLILTHHGREDLEIDRIELEVAKRIS